MMSTATSSLDGLKVQKGLLTAGLFILSIILAHVGLTRRMPMIGLLIPIVLICSNMISRPALLVILVLAFDVSKLLIPGITNTLDLAAIAQVLLIGWALLDTALRKEKAPLSFVARQDIWMILFSINLLMIMAVRGSGFAMLGSKVYGGAAYVSMILAALFYFSAERIRFSEKHIRSLLWALLIGAAIPALVQVAVGAFPAQLFWLSRYVDAQAEQVVLEQVDDKGVARWSSLWFFSQALIPVCYLFCRKNSTRIVLIGVAFFLVAMTGFRSRIFQIGTIIFFSSIYFSKNRTKTIILWALAGVMTLGFLMAAAPLLPRAAQRAVSFIPFIPVDSDIVERAAGSSDWRFDLWRYYCIPNVPRYLLVGRGAAHDITSFAWLQASWYGSSEFYYYMGRYHSGPFSLLLDYGLLGTVSFTAFFIMALKDAWRTVRMHAKGRDDIIARYYAFLAILLSYQIFHFYFVFGDVRSSLFSLLAIAVQLRILKKNLVLGEPAAAPEPAEAPLPVRNDRGLLLRPPAPAQT